MQRRSPTLEGFRTLFRLPSLGLAELAWRWSFGLAVTVLLAVSLREYLSTLAVTPAERFLLQTGQPALVLQTLARILRGSAPRAVVALLVLTLALTLAWIVLAALGRAATLTTLFWFFRQEHEGPPAWPLRSLMGLNFLRVASLLAAGIGSLGAVLVAGATATASKADPSPGSGLLIFWTLVLFIGLAWSALNWILSLSAIFVVGEGRTTFGALWAAVDLFRNRPAAVMAASTWFGIAHGVAFVIASSAAAFPLGLAGVLPSGVVLGGVILVVLVYFAIADFLHVGRLAAYVCLIEFPESVQPAVVSIQPEDDDILSDIPGLVPPPEPAT